MEETGREWRRIDENGEEWKRMEENGGEWRRMKENGRECIPKPLEIEVFAGVQNTIEKQP